MTKTNRLLVAALVLQVAILVIARFVQTDPQVVRPKPVLGALDSDDIRGIKVVDDDKVAELARQGESWVLASGGGFPVKADKIKELVGKFPALTAAEPVATKPEHHRALEVSAEENQRDITLTLKDGKTLRFFLGSSPGIKKAHLRLDGQNDVYAVEGLSTWDIGASASNWVETEYLKVDKDKLVALSLKNEDGTIELKKDGASWQLVAARPNETLKSTAVDSLVSSASSVYLNEPVGKERKPEYGLEQPKAVLTLVSESKVEKKKEGGEKDGEKSGTEAQPAEPEQVERKTIVLEIGAKKDDNYFAKSDASPFIVKIASWTAETFTNKKRKDLLEEPKKEEKTEQGQAKQGATAVKASKPKS